MKAPRKANGQFANKADMDALVEMIKTQTDIIKIYEWLDGNFSDPRTKWNYLKQAKKLAVDNG